MSIPIIYLTDSGNQVWQLGVTDLGAYTTTPVSGTGVSFILLQDTTFSQVWELTVLTTGALEIIPTTGSGLLGIEIVSPSGFLYTFVIDNSAIAIQQARNQIIGTFLNADGLPVANGYLKIHLTRDCAISFGGQIGRNSVITVPLDSSGSVSGTVLIWPNDRLLPTGNQYVFRVHANNGLLVAGPYLVSILSSPSPFILP